MLLALVCDPELQTHSGAALTDSEVSCSPLRFSDIFYIHLLVKRGPRLSLSASGLAVRVPGRRLLSAL